ncbi:MAG: hypothetical protein ABJW34_03980, partial [Flavobacteriaceae bacterium]
MKTKLPFKHFCLLAIMALFLCANARAQEIVIKQDVEITDIVQGLRFPMGVTKLGDALYFGQDEYTNGGEFDWGLNNLYKADLNQTFPIDEGYGFFDLDTNNGVVETSLENGLVLPSATLPNPVKKPVTYNGKVYFTTDHKIYRYDPETNETKTIFQLLDSNSKNSSFADQQPYYNSSNPQRMRAIAVDENNIYFSNNAYDANGVSIKGICKIPRYYEDYADFVVELSLENVTMLVTESEVDDIVLDGDFLYYTANILNGVEGYINKLDLTGTTGGYNPTYDHASPPWLSNSPNHPYNMNVAYKAANNGQGDYGEVIISSDPDSDLYYPLEPKSITMVGTNLLVSSIPDVFDDPENNSVDKIVSVDITSDPENPEVRSFIIGNDAEGNSYLNFPVYIHYDGTDLYISNYNAAEGGGDLRESQLQDFSWFLDLEDEHGISGTVPYTGKAPYLNGAGYAYHAWYENDVYYDKIADYITNTNPNATVQDLVDLNANPNGGDNGTFWYTGTYYSYQAVPNDGTNGGPGYNPELSPNIVRYDNVIRTDIASFEIEGQSTFSVDAENHTVEIGMPYGTDLNELIPLTITISPGATIKAANGVAAQNFNEPVVYTVTALDGTTTQDWEVTVNTIENHETDITGFTLGDQLSGESVSISTEDHTVSVQVNYVADLSGLVPTITLSDNATISPDSGEAVDFVSGVPFEYTVTAEDNTTQIWKVTITDESSETDIISFTIEGQTKDTEIDYDTHTINIEMPNGTELDGLVPEISIPAVAYFVGQGSGFPQDFSNDVYYGVEYEEDGVKYQQAWVVTVTTAEAEDCTLMAIAQDISVTLDANGQAFITADDIDDGSGAGCNNTVTLSLNRTDFSCTDVGTPVTVVLTVTGENNNTVGATAMVTVEDAIAPTVVTQDIAVTLDA